MNGAPLEMPFPGFAESVKDRRLPPLPTEAAEKCSRGMKWEELKSPGIPCSHQTFPTGLSELSLPPETKLVITEPQLGSLCYMAVSHYDLSLKQ